MIEEVAVVVKIDNHQVWVESGPNNACGGCHQKASCTTNAISSVLKKKSVPVDCDIQLKTGDEVMVAIDEKLLLRASLLLYLVPLIALFTGAGIADWLLADNALYADLWIAGSVLRPACHSKEAITRRAAMNVWAINKDLPLKLLLLELVHRYGENTLALNTREQHHQAIDICMLDDPSLSAYVYTFGQSTGRYGIDLRYPISAHNIVGENENLTLDQIIEIISTHLF